MVGLANGRLFDSDAWADTFAATTSPKLSDHKKVREGETSIGFKLHGASRAILMPSMFRFIEHTKTHISPARSS